MEVGLIIKDQYQVVEHIGRGGMADVWSARDQRLNRLVAIKTISQSLSTDSDPVALFQQEAQTIAQMEHPHILPIYDFGDYQSNLYIVMRYVTGGSLEDKLEEKPLTLQETLQIGGNIAKALDYAHANNVIHLDLKPPNILMDSGGSPYLADFGLATVLDTQGRAQNPGSGTLLYMAPEQLTAEVIDHRTDIYAFCVMVYHMLTGTLPFDGMVPLAIKQLQFREQLPDLDEFNTDIPFQITDILRQGTSTEPRHRQGSLTEIIDQMHEALKMSSIDLDSEWGTIDDFDESFGLESALSFNMDNAGLLEAADIYTRAKHVWAGGNGRFLLGVSHFMMMCDYYMDAETHSLEIDDMGQQMLLRGALEYDYQTAFWWAQVDAETRRWVCLHTIRSENAPARIRALYHLETLPDDDINPVIGNLVANALAIETNKEAKLAALNVLGTRAKLLKPTQTFNIKTEFRGRLLSTTTRLGLNVSQSEVWQDAVYTPEIDLLIANEALNDEDDDVTELAARIIGRIHSLTSLRLVAAAQLENAPHALRALALIRDEAPYLPDVVSPQARLYAWIANTVRRIADNPMQLVLRFLFALLGGSIGFGQQVYITYRSQALFTAQRWANTLAVGLLMGLFVAFLVMFSNVLISRLKGFWPNWLRLIVSLVFGVLLGGLTWTGFTWLYLGQPPLWDLMRMGGMGLAFGLVTFTMFNLKNWQSLILTTLIIFLAIFSAYFNNCSQIMPGCTTDGFRDIVEGVTSFSISPIVFVGFLFGSLFGVFMPRITPIPDTAPISAFNLTQFVSMGIILLLGLSSSFITYSSILDQAVVTWDHVSLLFAIPTLLSAIAMFMLANMQRILYFILGIIGFGILMLYVQDSLTGIETLIAPQVGENWIDPLVLFDNFWQVFSVGLPVSLVIAFGAFGTGIFSDLRHFIGLPTESKERNAWLTGILLYVMTISALITILAPFSLHKDVLWAVGWTFIGGMTFTTALATWQWKRWGAKGLIICSLIFIIGGFIADYGDLLTLTNKGSYSPIFEIQSLFTWGTWAIITGVLTIGVLRRKLWSAFGLIVMIFIWFVISLFLNHLGDSFTALAIVHAPLVIYALRFDWHLFESGKRKAKAKHSAQIPIPEPTPTHDLLDVRAVSPISNQMMETELDPNINLSADDLQTEPNSKPIVVDAEDMETELDVNQPIIDAEYMETELDPNIRISDYGLQTELDVQSIEGNDKPKVEPDTTHIEQPDDSNDDNPKFKVTTGLLSSKSDSPKSPDSLKSDTKSSRRGLKIDTSLLSSKSGDLPKSDTKSSRRGLKIDTGLLSSKPDKPDSEDVMKDEPDKQESDSKPKLKINTDLLKPDTDDPKPSEEDE